MGKLTGQVRSSEEPDTAVGWACMSESQPGGAEFRRRTQVGIGLVLVPTKALAALLRLHRQVRAPDEQVGGAQHG